VAKSLIERLRLKLSQVFIVMIFICIAFSSSAWEKTSPIVGSVLFISGLTIATIASLGRMWCSLYIAGRKSKVLVTEGPYSLSRNPLYVFSFIGAMGVGMATETFTYTCILALVFATYYPFVILSEERKLRGYHSDRFDEYLQTVPRFFPSFAHFREPQEYVVNPIVFRRHIFSALWFVWLICILELIEELHELGFLPSLFKVY